MNKQSDGFPTKRPLYIERLNRKECKNIVRARCSMLNVKMNQKNQHTDLKCRACNLKEETQVHVVSECTRIAGEPYHNYDILYSNEGWDMDELKKISERIERVEESLVTDKIKRDTIQQKLGRCQQ